jgi:hypothetical protein
LPFGMARTSIQSLLHFPKAFLHSKLLTTSGFIACSDWVQEARTSPSVPHAHFWSAMGPGSPCSQWRLGFHLPPSLF